LNTVFLEIIDETLSGLPLSNGQSAALLAYLIFVGVGIILEH